METSHQYLDIAVIFRVLPPRRVIDKQVYSAFMGSELMESLSALAADGIIVTGVEADVCVSRDSTGRGGFWLSRVRSYRRNLQFNGRVARSGTDPLPDAILPTGSNAFD
jgi:nicotinamidase-related amidase